MSKGAFARQERSSQREAAARVKNSDEDAVLSLLRVGLCTIPSQKGLEPVMAPTAGLPREPPQHRWMLVAGVEVASYCLEDPLLCMRVHRRPGHRCPTATDRRVLAPPRESDRARGFRKRALLADKKRFLRFDGYGASALTSFGSRGSRRSGRCTCRAVSERRRSRLTSTDLAVRTISPLLLTCRVKRPRMSVAEM